MKKNILYLVLAILGFFVLGLSLFFSIAFILSSIFIAIFITIIALIFAHKARRKIKKTEDSYVAKTLTLLTLIISYLNIAVIIFFVTIISGKPIYFCISPKMKSKDNLRQIYQLLFIYNMDYNSLPKVTPEGGNGVRDLYPLYETGIMKKEQFTLLKPFYAGFIPFSEAPTIDEFDKNHIGYAYNSTTEFDGTNKLPLLSDQGVSDGILNYKEKDKGTKPNFKGGANVLFNNRSMKWIPADRKGNLSTNLISKEEWKLLKD